MINVRDTLKIENNQLVIGGVKCEELAKEYNTPLYVMDKAHVVNMAKTYKNAMDKYYGFGQVSYASKAFCCKEIYRIINSCGIGIDVVSDGELYTALSVDFPSNKIIFHGNNKTPSELIYALDSKVEFIVIDSINEIELLDSICASKNVVQKVLIRVNPGVEAHTHHYIQTAKSDSKCGFSLSDGTAENAIKKILSTKYLKLEGLHCHIGSQIFDDKAFILAIDKMTDYYKYLKGEETSTNPVATIFAWSGALRKRGELDKLPDLIAFADRLENATIQTIEQGEMTGDLVGLFNKPGVINKKLSSRDFLKAIATRI